MRTHEKALANALQLKRERIKNAASTGASGASSPTTPTAARTPTHTSTSSAFAAALSFGTLSFTSHSVKPAKLTLTPHHLFYLLSRFEELRVDIGPMSVRIENLHAEQSPANYVSFLSRPPGSRGRSDRDSIHSVSSVRSVMSNMSSFWSGIGSGPSNTNAKTEKAKAQMQTDLKYLYSAFTKIPCLRLSPDRRARLISGYEEFPFDTAVPMIVFKNVSALEISDLDFRQFYGWDRMADQLRSLSVKRAHVDDPTDLIVHVVLDDMEKRRRRSSKPQSPPTPIWPASPSRHAEFQRMDSSPSTSDGGYLASSSSPRNNLYLRGESEAMSKSPRNKSASPTRPASSRQGMAYRPVRNSGGDRIKRSTSGSSNSSTHSLRGPSRPRSSSNLLSLGILPASKWRFLRHLSLADNSLTAMSPSALSPLANTLQSLDLSSNLFVDVPDSLANLTALRALNLSNCMINSLHSLARNPLPAITALNLRSNRLASIAGIERLLSLERLDVRENRIPDPTEMARLTAIPDLREVWVADNPFTRSHGSYRVTIFNLFRSAPGYTADILIDSAGPGYSERRQLRERVAEAAAVPIIRPPVPIFDAPGPVIPRPTTPLAAEPISAVPSRPLPTTTQSEGTFGPTRRKRGPRRRLVDLAIDDASSTTPKKQRTSEGLSSPPTDISRERFSPMDLDGTSPQVHDAPVTLPIEDPFVASPTQPSATSGAIHSLTPDPGFAHATAPSAPAAPSSPTNPSTSQPSAAQLARELRDLNLGGESYRRRVEALKEQFGSGWLHLLSHEGAHLPPPNAAPSAGPEPVIPAPHSLRPDLASVRSASQGIVGGGRTLG